MGITHAKIIGTGSYLPEHIITNADLEKMVDTNDQWIRERTGIEERRMIDESMATSDIALKASERALEMAGITADKIDLIIVATITPDHPFPATACILQDKLGAPQAAAFDLSAACSGFVYGLIIAEKFILSGMYKNILVVGAEALTRMLDFQDRGTCIIFGDGAGAAVVSASEDETGLLSTDMGANGKGGRFLLTPAGGSLMPATEQTVKDRMHFIKMDGSEVFKFAVRAMGSSALKVIDEAGLTIDEIDYLIPHQANIRIIEAAEKKLKLPREKVHVNIQKTGNTSAASIPIALDEAVRGGKIKKGDNVVLVGFGGGLTWASCVIKW